MSITIRDEVGSLPLERTRIRRGIRAVLVAQERKGEEVSVVLLDDESMRALNRQYRGKDKPTDVLAFPQAGPPPPPGVAAPLGDIVISMDTLRRDADEDGEPVDRHFVRLLTHGLLHLLGYDHHGAGAPAWRKVEPEAMRLAFAAAGVDGAP